MLFLIDENLPGSIGDIFRRRGFRIELVSDSSVLRGKPDEAIFDYAVKHEAVIVTRDLRFADPTRFALRDIAGLVILRFPTQITINVLCDEVERLTQDLSSDDFRRLLVIEPGSLRSRELV